MNITGKLGIVTVSENSRGQFYERGGNSRERIYGRFNQDYNLGVTSGCEAAEQQRK